MRICMDLGGVFYPGASDEDNAMALQVLLEALTSVDRLYLRRFRQTPSLYSSGVRYGRTQVWDSIPDLLTRRYGDCKSLTAMRLAELRESGDRARPVFRFLTRQGGHKDFHILIQRGDGSWEDPSRKLGMASYYQSAGVLQYAG